jgi:hypothetical protein
VPAEDKRKILHAFNVRYEPDKLINSDEKLKKKLALRQNNLTPLLNLNGCSLKDNVWTGYHTRSSIIGSKSTTVL